mgnify:CR=1 FL=1
MNTVKLNFAAFLVFFGTAFFFIEIIFGNRSEMESYFVPRLLLLLEAQAAQAKNVDIQIQYLYGINAITISSDGKGLKCLKNQLQKNQKICLCSEVNSTMLTISELTKQNA